MLADTTRRRLTPALRLVAEIATTWLLVFVTCFALLHAMPGDPSDRLDDPGIPAAQAERTRRALGLDRPWPEQMIRTLTGYAHGDLGISISKHRPVADVVLTALPPTVALGSAVLLMAYGLGLPLAGFLIVLSPAARRRGDRIMLALATVPRFWLAVILILVLHGVAGWFPASHATSPGGGGFGDRLLHLVLPALALGLPAVFTVARYQLAAMESTLARLHVAAARARGGSGSRLILKHVVRPSLGPVLTLIGLDLPVIVSGAIVVEVVFSWPGLGRLTVDAVLGGDYPLALATSLLTGTTVVLGRIVAATLADRLIPTRRSSHVTVGA